MKISTLCACGTLDFSRSAVGGVLCMTLEYPNHQYLMYKEQTTLICPSLLRVDCKKKTSVLNSKLV